VGVGLTGDAVIVDVVHRPIGVPVLGADDRIAIAPDFAERLAVGAIDRVGRAPFLAGDAVDHQLVGAVVVVGPGLRHAVGIAGAHLLAVGVHHLVVGVGLTGDAVIVDVVHRPIGVPVLGAGESVAL